VEELKQDGTVTGGMIPKVKREGGRREGGREERRDGAR
jgi:hypothetical protein